MTDVNIRPIVRALLFQKSLNKFTKRNDPLTGSEVHILTVFFKLGGGQDPVSASQVIQALGKCRKTPNVDDFYNKALSLADRGYLTRVDGKVRRYRLTVSAINWLNGFGSVLRNDRLDH